MSEHFIAVAYTDASLHLYSLAGTRLLPPLRMASAVSYLYSVDQYLVHIDCLGMLTLWNIIDQKAMLDNISCLAILTEKATVVSCRLHSDGMPILQTSNRQTFLYSFNMKNWIQLQELESVPSGFIKSLPKLEEIEMNLVSAVELKEKQQIVNAMKLYARKLADETAVSKTKELIYMLGYLCLIRGIGSVGGVEKSLLRDLVVPILAKNRSFQRLLIN
jgi:protein HIRA/HIR1